MDVDVDWCAPAACSLSSAEQPARVAEWDAIFGNGVRSVRPVDGGLRLDLVPGIGRASRVADLADLEAQCCRFFRFDLVIADDTLALTVRADPRHQPVVEALGARALVVSS